MINIIRLRCQSQLFLHPLDAWASSRHTFQPCLSACSRLDSFATSWAVQDSDHNDSLALSVPPGHLAVLLRRISTALTLVCFSDSFPRLRNHDNRSQRRFDFGTSEDAPQSWILSLATLDRCHSGCWSFNSPRELYTPLEPQLFGLSSLLPQCLLKGRYIALLLS